MNTLPRPLARRQLLILWLLGVPGVLALCLQVLPALLQRLLAGRTSGVTPELLLPIQALQSLLLLAAAVWLGGRLAPQLGLRSPLTAALAGGQSPLPVLRALVLPSLQGGGLVGALLLLATRLTPPELQRLQGGFEMPGLARLLYGGITEELLLRWGLMSALLWLVWRATPQRAARPGVAAVLLAVLLSALAFAAGHLPALSALLGTPPSAAVLAYVLLFNSLAGLVLGLLFWRHGLEAAMAAHALAHALALGAAAWF